MARSWIGEGRDARRAAAAFLAGLLALGLASCRSEEAFPSRPILLPCPWWSGGVTDLFLRQVATLLERAVPFGG